MGDASITAVLFEAIVCCDRLDSASDVWVLCSKLIASVAVGRDLSPLST